MRFLVLMLLSLPCFAEVESFQTGEELDYILTVCVSKASAVAILDADVKGGDEAATAAYKKADDCNSLPVTGGPTVGRVVYTVKVKRDKEELTAKVVEILDKGKVVAYFLTSKPVVAKLTVKPQNNS